MLPRPPDMTRCRLSGLFFLASRLHALTLRVRFTCSRADVALVPQHTAHQASCIALSARYLDHAAVTCATTIYICPLAARPRLQSRKVSKPACHLDGAATDTTPSY